MSRQRTCSARLGVALASLALGACEGAPTGTYAGFLDAPVAAIASPVAGRVVSVAVHEGDHVHRGDVLVQIDAVERQAALLVAQSNVEHAEAALHEASHQAQAIEPGVMSAAADLARAQAELDDATSELARAETLTGSGVATQSQLDAARARYLTARAVVEGGGAAARASRARVLAAFATVRTARAALETMRASLELARVQVEEATIRAPFDGVIAERTVREGEWAAPGTPVVIVEDTSQQWMRIDVEETAMTRLELGAPARIHLVAFPDRVLEGHVIQVGAEGEFAIDRDVRRGRPDIRTFRVRVGLDAPAEALRPGMTGEVVFPDSDGDAS